MTPLEREKVEQPAIQLLQQLGYIYRSGATLTEREGIHEVLLLSRLRAALRRLNPWLSDNNLEKALNQVTAVNGTSLLAINEKIWLTIKGEAFTVKQKIGDQEAFYPVRYIDYHTPTNNDFLVVNQIKYKGKSRNSIPDIVLYLNGLPIAVIECKSPASDHAFENAHSDLAFYQENTPRLFWYNLLCVGIWRYGGRYGAIGAPKQFYSFYRPQKGEQLGIANDRAEAIQQDQLLYLLFEPQRLLDMLRHFVIFELDEGRLIKKLPRYQQLRATNKTIARLQKGESGVVWHTQGSGKSLTMAFVTRKLQSALYDFKNPTVLILTDRKELDRQITTTFRNAGFYNVTNAASVDDLVVRLQNDYGGIITTTLQKFQEKDTAATNQTDQTQAEVDERAGRRIIKKIEDNQLTKTTQIHQVENGNGKWITIAEETMTLQQLSDKENIYVLVDEAHRSHYGFLAAFMRNMLPKAKFVAFTGTPISKEDKSTLKEFQGKTYIDVYTIMESVADGATVELLYDAGIAKMDVKKEALNREFDEKFGTASAEKRDKYIKAGLKSYSQSPKRIRAICEHLIDHYQHKIYPDGHKAMIVCDGRAAALAYKKMLETLRTEGKHNFQSKVIVSLGSAKTDKIAQEHYTTLEYNKKHPNKPKPVWLVSPEHIKTTSDTFKLPFGNEAETEKSGKQKYDNTAFLIVSDMLLTGYDAPIAACLYLDKPLKEHNLLQAIARVNRSREDKNAGFILDYYGITGNLIEALELFSGADIQIRPDDILQDLSEEIPRLKARHYNLVAFFKPLKIDRKYESQRFLDEAVKFLEPLDRRDTFKTLLKAFNKSINIVLPKPDALPFFSDFKLFNLLKIALKNTYVTDESLKVSEAESAMLRAMIYKHLDVSGLINLLEEPVSIYDKKRFNETLLHQDDASKELKMREKLKYITKVGLDKNPDFYKPIAQRLEELLQQKAAQQIDEVQLIIEYNQLFDTIDHEKAESEELGFTTSREIAVFNSMKTIFDDNAADATRTFFDLIKGELQIVGWKNKSKVQKDIEVKIMRYLKTKLDRTTAKVKAKEFVNLLKKN